MAIKFICTCGKHLRARDEMAARRSVCPRCGSPVGIPSRQPTQPGTTPGPLTPRERLRARRVVPSAEAVLEEVALATPAPSAPPAPTPPGAAPAAAGSSPRTPAPSPRLRKHLATRWRQGLVYP